MECNVIKTWLQLLFLDIFFSSTNLIIQGRLYSNPYIGTSTAGLLVRPEKPRKSGKNREIGTKIGTIWSNGHPTSSQKKVKNRSKIGVTPKNWAKIGPIWGSGHQNLTEIGPNFSYPDFFPKNTQNRDEIGTIWAKLRKSRVYSKNRSH